MKKMGKLLIDIFFLIKYKLTDTFERQSTHFWYNLLCIDYYIIGCEYLIAN